MCSTFFDYCWNYRRVFFKPWEFLATRSFVKFLPYRSLASYRPTAVTRVVVHFLWMSFQRGMLHSCCLPSSFYSYVSCAHGIILEALVWCSASWLLGSSVFPTGTILSVSSTTNFSSFLCFCSQWPPCLAKTLNSLDWTWNGHDCWFCMCFSCGLSWSLWRGFLARDLEDFLICRPLSTSRDLLLVLFMPLLIPWASRLLHCSMNFWTH